MPDLITHLATGYVAAIPLRRRSTLRLALLSGVLLPDLLTRPIYILIPGTSDFVMPLHTPIGYSIACWLFTQFFEEPVLRKTILTGLLAGGYKSRYGRGLTSGIDRSKFPCFAGGGTVFLNPFSRQDRPESWGNGYDRLNGRGELGDG